MPPEPFIMRASEAVPASNTRAKTGLQNSFVASLPGALFGTVGTFRPDLNGSRKESIRRVHLGVSDAQKGVYPVTGPAHKISDIPDPSGPTSPTQQLFRVARISQIYAPAQA
jgi:hypothetical protein